MAQTLIELQKERSIQLDDLVVAIRRDNGKIKLKQSFSPAGTGAAVFVLVSQSTPDKVLPRISQYGGEIIHSSLSEHAEETLQEALRERATA